MGFNSAGLGPSDLSIVTRLQPEIIQRLRHASMRIQQGRAEAKAGSGLVARHRFAADRAGGAVPRPAEGAVRRPRG